MLRKQSKIFIYILLLSSPCIRAQHIQWVFKPGFENIQPFREGIAVFQNEELNGYLNEAGQIILQKRYEKLHPFSEGVGILTNKAGELTGIADPTGNIIKTPPGLKTGSEFPAFSNRLLLVSNGSKWGYLNTSGKLEIECKFELAYPFSEGLAPVTTSRYFGTGRWAYINTSGRAVILQDLNLTWASGFKNGMALVVKKNKIYFLDKKGEKIKTDYPSLTSIENRYDLIKDRINCKEGSIFFDEKLRISSIQTAEKEIHIPIKKQEPINLRSFKRNNLYGLIFKKDSIPAQFDNIPWTGSNLAIVRKNNRFGVIKTDTINHLSMEMTNPELCTFFGNPAEINIKVTNTGQSVLENLNLLLSTQQEFPVGTMNPGNEKKLNCRVKIMHGKHSDTTILNITPVYDDLILPSCKMALSMKDCSKLEFRTDKKRYYSPTDQKKLKVFILIKNPTTYYADSLRIKISADKMSTVEKLYSLSPGETKKIPVFPGDYSNLPATIPLYITAQTKDNVLLSKTLNIQVTKETRNSENAPKRLGIDYDDNK